MITALTILTSVLLPMGIEKRASETGDVSPASTVSIAMTGAGDFHAAWEDAPGAGGVGHLWIRHFAPDGSPLGAETALTTSSHAHTRPVLAVSGAQVFAAWERQVAAGNKDIRFGIVSNGTAGDGLVASFINSSRNQHDPQITVGSDGNAYVAWVHDYDATDSDIYVRGFSPVGSALFTDAAVAQSSLSEREPALAALADPGASGTARLVLAYTKEFLGKRQVHYRVLTRTDSGVSSSLERRANLSETPDHRHPAVVALPDGGFLLGWSESAGGQYVAKYRRFGADGLPSTGTEHAIGGAMAGFVEPHLAADAGGGFVAAWSDGGRAWFDEFDASGAVVQGRVPFGMLGAGETAVRAALLPDGAALQLAAMSFACGAPSPYVRAFERVAFGVDSDGDGFSDALERQLGSDPHDNASRPAAFDLNGDGAVDSGDALLFYRMTTGAELIPEAR